jgi:prophage antirepressor-like protein
MIDNKENKAMSLTVTEGLTVQIIPHLNHEFLMTGKEVANGYGSNEYAVRMALSRNSSELQEGKHFVKGVTICHTLPNAQPHQVFWTKRGIVRLGFFIKSKNAKLFRDWAEDLIINKLGEQTTLFDVQPKALHGKRKHNRLTAERMIDILHDVCKIEDAGLRSTISSKLKGGYNV